MFANIYLNELDHFIKRDLRQKFYLRYADDFIILASSRAELAELINPIQDFLKVHLKLSLHPDKIFIRNLNWGIDFLGYIVLPGYVLPRTKTKKRMIKRLKQTIDTEKFEQSLQSYLGYLSHAKSYQIIRELQQELWLGYNR